MEEREEYLFQGKTVGKRNILKTDLSIHPKVLQLKLDLGFVYSLPHSFSIRTAVEGIA